MSREHVRDEDFNWECVQCGCPLIVGPVTVSYMGNDFRTELARCPECGMAMISESVAMGKMAQVERILEDK